MSRALKQHKTQSKPSFWQSLTGVNQVLEEKNMLEAFLNAFPGDYCGFTGGDAVVYSRGFLELFNLSALEGISDLLHALKNDDAATLEGLFVRLQESGKTFVLQVDMFDGEKVLEISGSRGVDSQSNNQFYILWVKDVTDTQKDMKRIVSEHQEFSSKLTEKRSMLNVLPLAMWLRDQNGEIIWCNNHYAAIHGVDVDDVIRDQKEISLSQKGQYIVKSVSELAEKVRDSAESKSLNCHVIAGGKRRFVHISESPVEGTDYTLGTLNDKTEEEELETRLQRYVGANETLLEQLRSAIALFDSNHALEFFNSAFSALWGLEEQWLNTHPKLGDILEKLRETRRLPEQADFRSYKQGWLDMFTRLIEPDEDMMYLPDGSALRLLIVPHPMGGLMMTFEDVTSRLELESSYNTLIAVQRETLDNLAEAVVVYGTDGRLKLCNPSFLKLWGLNPEDVEGEPHVSVIVSRMVKFFDAAKIEKKTQQLTAHGIERSIQEGRIARKDETLLEFSTVPLPDGGVLISYFDVTASTRVENALREKNQALEAAEKLKTDFLANVSYQLRTPLNAIMGFAEILDNQYFGDLNDKQVGYTKGIREAGDKLVHLIDDILDLSTIEAGYLDLSMSEFVIKDMLDGLYSFVEDWARKEEIDISIDCDASVGTLIADESRLKQVMLNLLHNAILYTPAKGSINISVEKREDDIEFKVSDSGIGISKKDLERIFEPFERAVAEHRADMSSNALSRGAGLGLSLVKNIVELHGGHVEISSEEDKGTTVSFFIPLQPVLEPVF